MKIRTGKPFSKQVKFLITVLVAVVAINVLYMGYAFLSSPGAVRKPAFEHYHMRLQVLVDGKAENFAGKKYQVAAAKDVCNTDLATAPFHFHDNKDQMVHVHWDHMTGGQLLKYYGWNYAGGAGDSLGYRFDNFPKLEKVAIHGKDLPAVPKDAKFYVYVGDEKGYKQKDFTQFVHQDLEKFLGQKSNLPEEDQASLFDKLFPKAYAHAGHEHTLAADAEDLKELNNLIGNVVVFVQKDKPSADQIKARFNALEPLSKSTCAG